MKSISFFVAGIPKGQPRPKAFARNMGGGKFAARVYDPGTAENWKGQVALSWRAYRISSGEDNQLLGPLSVTLVFRFPRPKAHRRKNGELKPSAPHHHIGKPDCDNAAKAVMDALTQLGAWYDDAQVAELRVTKSYSSDEYGCGCEIEMRELEQ